MLDVSQVKNRSWQPSASTFDKIFYFKGLHREQSFSFVCYYLFLSFLVYFRLRSQIIQSKLSLFGYFIPDEKHGH